MPQVVHARHGRRRSHTNLLTGAAIAAAAASCALSPARIDAAPIFNLKVLARLAGSADPFSATVGVSPGAQLEYEIVGNMSPVGTIYTGAGGFTITSLTANMDGSNALRATLFELTTDPVQVTLGLGTLATNWAQNSDNSVGSLVPRGNGNNDVSAIRPIRAAGNFGAVAPEVIYTGTMSVTSFIAGIDSLLRIRWSSGSGSLHVNGSPGLTKFPSLATETGTAPFISYTALTMTASPGNQTTWQVDASGNWSTGANWNNGVPNSVDAIANFGNVITAPRTVTVDAPQTVGSIKLNSTNSYTIDGTSPITLNVSTGSADITASTGSHTVSAPIILGQNALLSGPASGALTISGTISGLRSVTISSGRVDLTASNSFTGSLVVASGGTLAVSNDTAMGNAANSLDLSNGTLLATAGFTTARAIPLSGTGTVNTNGFNVSLTGTLAASGGLTKAGLGALTISGSNSYSGNTRVAAGTLRAAAVNTIPGISSVQVDSGATLDLAGFSQTVASIAGTGATIALGSATLTTGNISISTTYDGTISGTGSLVKIGNGTLTLIGSSSYSGGTFINGGVLAISAANSLGNTASTVTMNGGTLRANATFNAPQPVSLAAGGGTFDDGLGLGLTLDGVISGTGTLTKTGAGTLTLTASNSYSGGTVLNGGLIRTSSDANLGAALTPLSFGGGVLRLDTNYSTPRPMTLNAGGGTIEALGGTSTFSGAIAGAGSFSKQGGGRLVLSSSNTYSGGTNVQVGILTAQATGSLGSAGVSVSNNATLEVGSSATLANSVTLSGSGWDGNGALLALGGASTISGSVALSGSVSIGVDSGSLNVLSNVTGSGASLTKLGGGTLTLSGSSSTYSGATTVSGGTLRAGVAQALPSGTGVTVASVGTLDLNNFNLAVASIAGPGLIQLGSGTLTVNGGLFTGSIAGTGGVTINGAGLSLSSTGNNTYSGATNLNTNLSALASGAFSPNSSVIMATGSSLSLNNLGQTIGSLGGTGSVTLGTATLTTGGNGATSVYSGNIIGSGGLTKEGAGDMTLVSNTSYTGPTNVNGGKLIINGQNFSSTYRVGSGGTLRLNGGTLSLGPAGSLRADAGGAIEYNGSTVNGSFLRGPGSHVLVGGSNTFNGVTTLNGTVLQQNSSATLTNFTNGGVITNNAPLVWDGGSSSASGDITVNNTFAVNSFDNSGVVTVNSTGVVNSTGTNFVHGGGARVTVNPGGQVNLQSGTSIDMSGALLVNNGTVNGNTRGFFGSLIKGSGTFNGSIDLYDGSHFSPGSSPGAVTSSSASFNAGGSYMFEIRDAAGPAGVGMDYWNVVNSLTINAGTTTNTRFLIDVDTLNIFNGPGAADNFNSASDYSWTLVHTGSGITGFSPSKFFIDTSGFANSIGTGHFEVTQSGNDLVLNFVAIPEPTGLMTLSLSAMAFLGARRRRAGAV